MIDEYRFNGEDSLSYKTTFTFDDLPEDYFAGDFFYHEASNSFYVLESREVPMVTVYQIMEEH